MKYKTQGVCAQSIEFEVIDGKLHNVQFVGGCSGNQQGLGTLVEGMEVNDVIHKLEGIRCGYRPTSCPDQLAKALKNIDN